MSEQSQEAVSEVKADESPEGEQAAKTYDEDYVKQLRAEAAKYRTQAKAAATEAEKVRNASLSEAERAVADAKAAGRTEAVAEFGTRLAQTEVRAQAADAGADLAGVFDYLDLKRFVTEDGEPDTKAIKSFVDGLPKKVPATGGLDLGARTTVTAGGDMNQALRQALGRS